MRFPILAVILFSATVAHADGGVTVPLPTIPQMPEADLEHLLRELVVANVVSANCQGFEYGTAEWALLTGSADLIAQRLGIGVGEYDVRFYGPAFAMLGKPETCATQGPRVRPLINRLIAWGGSLTPAL